MLLSTCFCALSLLYPEAECLRTGTGGWMEKLEEADAGRPPPWAVPSTRNALPTPGCPLRTGSGQEDLARDAEWARMMPIGSVEDNVAKGMEPLRNSHDRQGMLRGQRGLCAGFMPLPSSSSVEVSLLRPASSLLTLAGSPLPPEGFQTEPAHAVGTC